MNSAPDSNTGGPGRVRLFGVAGLTAVVALGLTPLSFHVERRLDTAVPLKGSESDYVSQPQATHFSDLARTAGLINGAAAMMIVVFAGFALGDFLVIKMLGFTLAVAVLIDATRVRVVIGPALLSLVGDWNGWPWGLADANAIAAQERIR
jgi:uncharacterized membrane protein YdfJ with MMPL/SSD domain